MGDALADSASVEDGAAGIIVDLFTDGQLIPQLTQVWEKQGRGWESTVAHAGHRLVSWDWRCVATQWLPLAVGTACLLRVSSLPSLHSLHACFMFGACTWKPAHVAPALVLAAVCVAEHQAAAAARREGHVQPRPPARHGRQPITHRPHPGSPGRHG